MSDLKNRVLTLALLLTLQAVCCTEVNPNFQVQVRGSQVIQTRWNAQYNINSSAEFRIVVNGNLDPTCRSCNRTPDEKFCYCELTGYPPNAQYNVQLAVCSLEKKNLEHCTVVTEDRAVYLPPEAPSSFTAEPLQDTSIQFAWKTPDQNIDGLRISMWAWNNEDRYALPVSASVGDQTGVLDTVKPLTLYNTSVSIVKPHENIEIKCSQVIQVLTFPNVPTITVADVGGTWILVKFAPMQGGIAFGVHFNAKATDGNGEGSGCSVKSSNQDAVCLIEGLQFSTVYTITAVACIDAKCSVESPTQTNTTLGEDKPKPTTLAPSTPSEETTTEAELPPTDDNSNTSTALSGGAIAGIVTGVAAGILLIVIALVFICNKIKSKSTDDIFDVGSFVAPSGGLVI